MVGVTIASSEFQTRAGLYMEHAAKGPVFITKYSRPVRVLIDIEEYDRLKARDTRRAYAAEEIPAEWAEALNDVDLSHIDPELNKLID